MSYEKLKLSDIEMAIIKNDRNCLYDAQKAEIAIEKANYKKLKLDYR